MHHTNLLFQIVLKPFKFFGAFERKLPPQGFSNDNPTSIKDFIGIG